MIIEFFVIFFLLTLTGFPIINLLYPSTNIIFKLSCAAYLSSLVIIISASIFFRVGLNVNYCIFPFIGISLVTWYFFIRKTKKNIINIDHREKLKILLIVGGIIVISSLFLVYPSFIGAYGIFHMGPDFYGYGMSTSYIQDGNTLLHLKQTFETVTGVKNQYDPRVSTWQLADLREAVSIDFIYRSNRYGIQSLAAVLDNLIFHSNSAVKLLLPIMIISIIATVSSVYQLMVHYKTRTIYAILATLLVCFNINHLVAIIEGSLGSVFSLAMPLLLCIAISYSNLAQKTNQRLIWSTIFSIVILLSSSLIIYQEVTGILLLFIFAVTSVLLIVKDKKNILNLTIAGALFFIINSDILINFILSIYSRFQQGFAGASLNFGFLDFLGTIGLIQPYNIIPHTIPPLNRQSYFLIYSTIVVNYVLFFSTYVYYRSSKIIEVISIVVFLGLYCLSMTVSLIVLKNYFITWKLTYAFLPLIIIALILLFENIQQFLEKSIDKYSVKSIFKRLISIAIIILIFSFSLAAIWNYVCFYKSYIRNSDFILINESKAFDKGIFNNRILLTMSENQLYYLPGFHGGLYWLNSGWVPIFDVKEMRDNDVILVIFEQLEGEKFFNAAKKYFSRSILYSNEKVIVANLGVPCATFINDSNKTNRDYMQNFLDNIRKRILSNNH